MEKFVSVGILQMVDTHLKSDLVAQKWMWPRWASSWTGLPVMGSGLIPQDLVEDATHALRLRLGHIW